ncbi:NAD(P)-dependent oxidoreductase [Seohaeicola zhoushanensis]
MRPLDALGPDGVLINIGRGSVVDEAALIRVLDRGGLLAAGLDVLADEPRIPEGLRDRDNVVILPHVGGATVANRDRIGVLQARNILSWFAGRGPVTPVPETPVRG